MLSQFLQKKIDQHIPKKDQKAFIEQAVTEKINSHIAMTKNQIEIYIDGGSRGNPGPAGGGFVIYQAGKEVLKGSEFYGEKTNNQSEYLALRTALREAFSKFPESSIQCYMDSQLVVEQMSGNYKVKSPNVKPLFEEVSRIADQFNSFHISHIPREQNKVADQLANDAMDKRQ